MAFSSLIFTLGYATGSQGEQNVANLTLDETVDIVDGFLGDPKCVKETTEYLLELEVTNPALYQIIADATDGLSGMPGADLVAISVLVKKLGDGVGTIISDDNKTVKVYDGGRVKYMCVECGKVHDRKSRADDCRNVDVGIRPHVCRGECGDETWCVDASMMAPSQTYEHQKNISNQSYAAEQLLVRHWSPKKKRMKRCNEW